MLSKSIRFYDSKREQEILNALSRHREYGYDNERQMMLDAIYQLMQKHGESATSDSPHNPSQTNHFDEDAFLDKLIRRLKSEQMIAVTSSTPEPTDDTEESTVLSKEAEESNLDNALDFIGSLI